MSAVVIFSTASEIEARVVLALLDSRGIQGFRSSGDPTGLWPMTVNTLGGFRIAVREEEADEARRVIESHRADADGGARIVRISDEFEDLEARIGHRFRDRGLVEHALTHRSRAAEDVSGGVMHNESLEFLGDAVLGLVIADLLFHQFPAHNEGQKSKMRAAVVSTASLARHAERLNLGAHLLLGRGEEKTGGRFKQALLADAYEALIAAVYLDGGLAAASDFLRREFQEAIDDASQSAVMGMDYKSALQERLQSRGGALPEYRLVGQEGPDHRKLFSIEVVTSGETLAAATGKTKKEAEQEAARLALARLESGPGPRA